MSKANVQELMESILLALRQDIKPALTQDYARHRAELIDMLLSRLAVTMGKEDADLLLDIVEIATDDVISSFVNDPSAHHGMSARSVLNAVKTCATSEHLRRDQTESQVNDMLTFSVAAQEAQTKAEISLREISNYLKTRYPNDATLQATAMENIPGGRSKGTILLKINGDAERESLIIRHDLSNMVTGSSVAYEYPILAKLWDQGAKVPKPLWFDSKNSLFGGAFVALEKVPGKALGTMFSSTASPELILQFAEIMAHIHNIDIYASGLSEDLTWGNEDNPVKTMLQTNFEKYRKQGLSHPLLEHAFAWLFLRIDTLRYQPALIHGDAGLHNALATDQEVTAILDWELAHTGDPAEDLSYCRDVVESNLPWQEFISAYQAHAKQEISPDRITFFTIWRSVQLAVQTLTARNLFNTGQDRDLRLAAIAYNTLPKFLNRLAQDLETHCGNDH
jgi:aminoglycoside phosphotransferase (APT) family kinase protein